VDQTVNSLGGFTTGRFIRPDEVADLVLMLAGDRAADITGADFTIDGGLIKTLWQHGRRPVFGTPPFVKSAARLR
jgi:hypothetical protein